MKEKKGLRGYFTGRSSSNTRNKYDSEKYYGEQLNFYRIEKSSVDRNL